ncbi:MAG TPA: GNAT family N-acetyltransferase [Candidatus Binatia bacterium]|nr:GNAT family N-acetyltransferase [Candidatus Binatia bacterium]
MIELTPLDKDEWMPRIRVQVLTDVSEARAALEELDAAGIHPSIQSLQILAQRDPAAEWPEAYVVRLNWKPASIIGWADAEYHDHRRAVLAWETAARYRDHAYMREAAPRIVQWLVRRRGVREVQADIPIGDLPSEKVAAVAGLTASAELNGIGTRRIWTTARPEDPEV